MESVYPNAAWLALCLLLYAAITGRVERSWLSGPLLFTGAGFLLGPGVLGWLKLNVSTEWVRALAEAALAMVLFSDAAHANFRAVLGAIGLPERLLLIGLPLTILLGFGLAWLMFPSIAVLEVALLAAMLAPTDAALGKPVVANKSVPENVREALNLESGLNDGICVPVIVILLGFAVGAQVEHSTLHHILFVIGEEIGIGLIAGIGVTFGAVALLRAAHARGWITEEWLGIPAIATATACFAAAQALGGSGFIACFTGGLVVSWLNPPRRHDLLGGVEIAGETLALLTWAVFGAVIVAPLLARFSWLAVLYAVLSLTLIRMLPVWLCLTGTGMTAASKLFIGWFGPRGLASVVFAIIVLQEKLPGNDLLMTVTGYTVLLSILAHGLSATPLIAVLRARLPG
jgi:NhaP-type Na+/H+ or K+/H+ antiporter